MIHLLKTKHNFLYQLFTSHLTHSFSLTHLTKPSSQVFYYTFPFKSFSSKRRRQTFQFTTKTKPYNIILICENKKKMMRGHQDQQSKIICELSSLVFNLLQFPSSPSSFSDRSPIVPVHPSVSSFRRSSTGGQITPAGFAALLLGISTALMLCGSVTFFIGFMLLPWVLGLVMVFYVAGIVSSLSVLGRSVLCFASPRKDFAEWKLS